MSFELLSKYKPTTYHTICCEVMATLPSHIILLVLVHVTIHFAKVKILS